MTCIHDAHVFKKGLMRCECGQLTLRRARLDGLKYVIDDPIKPGELEALPLTEDDIKQLPSGAFEVAYQFLYKPGASQTVIFNGDILELTNGLYDSHADQGHPAPVQPQQRSPGGADKWDDINAGISDQE